MATESPDAPTNPPEGGRLLRDYETGIPTGAPAPPLHSAKVSSDGDKTRWILGTLSYAVGVVAFLGIAVWAMRSLDSALQAAAKAGDGLHAVTQPVALLYVAKAVLVLTVGSFAVALIRTAERLTMPLVHYLQMVEYQTRPKVSEEGSVGILDAASRLIDTVKGSGDT